MKKRKNTAANEEESAKEINEAPAVPNRKKLKKKIKRNKLLETARTPAESSGDEEQDLHEPTLEELLESEKPENNVAIVTVRKKKKQKHQQRVEAQKQKDQTGDKEKQRNESYLLKWKNSRTDWKFEKLRQISIQHTVFDEEKISAEIWPLALEYLSGSKGASKDATVKLAEEVINKLDQECAAASDDSQSVINSVKYQRARDLLQSLE